MKRFCISVVALFISIFCSAQIMDSLNVGARSITYEIIAASKFEDFGANKYGNKLLYVSSRETSVFSNKYGYNNQKYFDLFLYDLESEEVSRYAENLLSISEGKYHMGPSILLPDSSGVILSRNYKLPNKDGTINFFLVHENFNSGLRYILPFCTPDYSFQHPYYDDQSRRLYFSTNLIGGPGGYDIYYSHFGKNDTWSDPVLLDGINSPKDEVFPSINNKKLYFSKREAEKDLDVFVYDIESSSLTKFFNDSKPSHDRFAVISLNGDSAVFSQSQRGRYNTDLVLAYVETDVAITDTLEVIVNQDSSMAIIKEMTEDGINSVLEHISPAAKEEVEGLNDGLKKYSTIVGVFDDIKNAEGYLNKVKKWSQEAFISLYDGHYYLVSAGYVDKETALDNQLLAVENGVPDAWLLPKKLAPISPYFQRNSPDLIVYFQFDKYDVMAEYKEKIDEVISKLPNDVEKVLMVGHTDSRGSIQYNDKLSRKRVEAVADYIHEVYPFLVETKELDFKGERQLTNECGDNVKCNDNSHLLNRRVEIWFD